MNYTAHQLLSELKTQGVLLQIVSEASLHIKGELTDEQLQAVRQWKPQIINAIQATDPKTFKFTENDYLFNNLERCMSIFDVSNLTALRFIRYLMKYCEKCEPTGAPVVRINQPTTQAYISELNLIDGILKREKAEISDRQLKCQVDKYLSTHKEDLIPADWLQDRDAPLYSITLRKNGDRFDFMIGNTIQIAIAAAYWRAVDPEITCEIAKA